MARSPRSEPSGGLHPLSTEALATSELGAGPRVVLAHGFTQTGRSWGSVGAMLAQRYRVVLADLPGHGQSGHVMASLEDGATLLGAAGGRAAYVGYSMGGRHCLRLALDHPELVTALVLVGASPGIVDPEDRRTRRAADEALADRLDPPGQAGAEGGPSPRDRAGPQGRPGPEGQASSGDGREAADERQRLDAFLAEWLAGPLFAHLPREAAGLEARRENTCAGLAASLRLAGAGAMEPLWDRLGALAVPTLLVVGKDDARYRRIAERMATAAERPIELAVVPGAGHAVPFEAPAAFAAIVRDFLEGTIGTMNPG